jgi:hypothetical protein
MRAIVYDGGSGNVPSQKNKQDERRIGKIWIFSLSPILLTDPG